MSGRLDRPPTTAILNPSCHLRSLTDASPTGPGVHFLSGQENNAMHPTLRTTLLTGLLMPAMALAMPQQGTQEITLGGAGSSDKDFDETILSIAGSWGTYVSPRSQWGIRQTISARDSEGESTRFDGATRIFYDYHFGGDKARPFVGLSVGGIYGKGVDDTFTGGPEVGLKYYVLNNTFILGLVEYQFLFDSASDVDDRFDDGAFFYSLGIGYNF
jgi:hypothetical protein